MSIFNAEVVVVTIMLVAFVIIKPLSNEKTSYQRIKEESSFQESTNTPLVFSLETVQRPLETAEMPWNSIIPNAYAKGQVNLYYLKNFPEKLSSDQVVVRIPDTYLVQDNFLIQLSPDDYLLINVFDQAQKMTHAQIYVNSKEEKKYIPVQAPQTTTAEPQPGDLTKAGDQWVYFQKMNDPLIQQGKFEMTWISVGAGISHQPIEIIDLTQKKVIPLEDVETYWKTTPVFSSSASNQPIVKNTFSLDMTHDHNLQIFNLKLGELTLNFFEQ